MQSNTKTAEVLNAAPTADAALLAFLDMQKEIPVIPKSRDGYNFKYAPYEQIAKLAFPVMWEHGFVIRHEAIIISEANRAAVRTTITHVMTGREWTSVYEIDSKAKDQERGKSLTYGKRYNTALLLGLSIEGEPDRDDDVPKSAASASGSDF